MANKPIVELKNDMILGYVSNKYQPPKDPNRPDSGGVTFLTLSGTVNILVYGDANKLPVNGSLIAAAVVSSRGKSKSTILAAWGFPQSKGDGSLNKGVSKLFVEIQGQFPTSPASGPDVGIEES